MTAKSSQVVAAFKASEITEQTYRVLYEGLPPREAVYNLLNRVAKQE